VGVLVLLLLKPQWKSAQRWTALVTSLVTFGLSLWLLSLFNSSDGAVQLELNLPGSIWAASGGFHRGRGRPDAFCWSCSPPF
jgi:NADH:ubiquinone oxidoreductase subunit 4 (subunit M)